VAVVFTLGVGVRGTDAVWAVVLARGTAAAVAEAVPAGAWPPAIVRVPCRYGVGSTGVEPWRTSKCRCGPEHEPVHPT
jgi:hypothetical protein